MTERILFKEEAKDKLKQGIDTLANAVKTTLGPNGENVIIDNPPYSPIVTKDGVTVAKNISLEDKFEDLGAQLIKEVALNSELETGDGTTTATVLTQEIISIGRKYILAGASPLFIKKGMDKALKTVIKSLEQQSRFVGNKYDTIKQVATISANGDELIGKLIADTITSVGIDGSITVEESNNTKTTVDIVKGLSFEKGYQDTSSIFVTDEDTLSVVYENPVVFITNQKIKTIVQLQNIIKETNTNRPLLIIADKYSNETIDLLSLNKLHKGVKVVAVKADFFNDNKEKFLEDIAIVTGAKVFTGADFNNGYPTIKDCGEAEKIIITKNSTTIMNGKGDDDKLEERKSLIKKQMKEAGLSDHDKEISKKRLSRLAGGVAVIKAGGVTEAEMGEVKDRIDDAVGATKSAIEEGIVPGGGIALLRASQELGKIEKVTNDDEFLGINIIARAIEKPLIQIAENSGVNSGIVLEKVKSKIGDYGYDARNDKYKRMFNAGIIDPKKVTRIAIENAISVAKLFLTTNCVISNN